MVVWVQKKGKMEKWPATTASTPRSTGKRSVREEDAELKRKNKEKELEIQRLKKENARLREERDILKKWFFIIFCGFKKRFWELKGI